MTRKLRGKAAILHNALHHARTDVQTLHIDALELRTRTVNTTEPELRITAQHNNRRDTTRQTVYAFRFQLQETDYLHTAQKEHTKRREINRATLWTTTAHNTLRLPEHTTTRSFTVHTVHLHLRYRTTRWGTNAYIECTATPLDAAPLRLRWSFQQSLLPLAHHNGRTLPFQPHTTSWCVTRPTTNTSATHTRKRRPILSLPSRRPAHTTAAPRAANSCRSATPVRTNARTTPQAEQHDAAQNAAHMKKAAQSATSATEQPEQHASSYPSWLQQRRSSDR